MRKEWLQSRSLWWIWFRHAANGCLMCYFLCIRKPGEKPNMKVNFIWARELSSVTWRVNLLKTIIHPATQSGTLTRIGFLKSGNLMVLWRLELGDLLWPHSARTHSLLRTRRWFSYTEAELEMSLLIFLAQGELFSAKEAAPIFKRYTERQQQTFC